MACFTGRTHQPSTIPEDRVDHFVHLASAVDALVNLPVGDLLRSDWILSDSDEAEETRAFGSYWWRHIATGYSYFLNPSFLPRLAPLSTHPPHSKNASLRCRPCWTISVRFNQKTSVTRLMPCAWLVPWADRLVPRGSAGAIGSNAALAFARVAECLGTRPLAGSTLNCGSRRRTRIQCMVPATFD